MEIKCHHCNQKYEVDESYIGQTVQCQTCGKEFEFVSLIPSRREIDRPSYILLGLFLGGLGAHNFYEGKNYSGIVKITLSVATIVLAAAWSNDKDVFVWIIPAIINGILVIYDIVHDPNVIVVPRNKKMILGMRPFIFVIACVFFVPIIILLSAVVLCLLFK